MTPTSISYAKLKTPIARDEKGVLRIAINN
jgi:hypothetical protein